MTLLHDINSMDFTAQRAEIERIDARLTELASASEAGRKRQREIGQALSEIRNNDRDGRHAAQALINGGDIMEAMPSETALHDEGAALREALSALGREESDLRREREAVLEECNVLVGEALEETCADILRRAQEASVVLGQAYVNARALERALHAPEALKIATALKWPVKNLALKTQPRLLPEALAPSPEIAAAIDGHAHRDLLRTASSRPVRLI